MSLSTRSQLRSTHPYLAWSIGYILDAASHWGGKFTITSVNRTAAKQQELFRRAGSSAARPGCSQHQYGAAVDVIFEDPRWQDWYLASARNFGLTTVRGDSVHVQLIPGARFREWAEPRGLCPDPNYPVGNIERVCGVGSGATSVSTNAFGGFTCFDFLNQPL